MVETTVSYWVRESDDPNAAAMELLDVQQITPLEPLWDDTPVVVLGLPGTDLRLRVPITADFAERYDVVRRVSAPKPTPDALSYVVTFVNHDYRTPGGRAPRHQVELWSVTPLDVEAELEGLAFAAAELWPEAGWAGDDPRWWVENVHTPSGDLVKPEM